VHRIRAEQKLANNRVPEVALGQLDHQCVPILAIGAQIGERILISPLGFNLARALQEQVRFANEVERDVRERDVLFENRTMSAPLAQPMAEDEPIVTEPKQVLEKVRAQENRTPCGTL
jgi:hypothetical protein